LIPQFHVWVVDSGGHVLLTKETIPPLANPRELARARSGEDVAVIRRNARRVIVPMKNGELMVLERTLLARGTEYPGFPLLIWLVVSIVSVALLVWPLSIRFTKPLRQLHSVVQYWAEGRLDQRAKISGSDEISELGSVFNLMAENLEKMLQQRKEFLAMISHELKSPISRLQVASQMLLEKANSDQSASVIRGMQTDLEESSKLIEQLLQLSRIEMGLSFTVMQRIDFADIIGKAMIQIEPTAAAAQVRLEWNEQRALPIDADPQQLERAVLNVLENAVKYSPSGSEVTVNTHRENGFIFCNVSDHGSGISSEELEKVFEPFYRGIAATGKEGTGLGLFLARRIIELHHGQIKATTNQPGGTTISIQLPASSTSEPSNPGN